MTIASEQPRAEWSGPVVQFDLPRGNMVEIRLRSKLTKDEFAKLKMIFDLSSLAFVDDDAKLDTDIQTLPTAELIGE